jgi:hypothetical protein
MTAVAQTTLHSLLTSELTAEALEARTASGARVSSALTDWSGLDIEQRLALVAEETTVPRELEVAEVFGDERHEALVITGRIESEPTAQLLFAAFNEDGEIAELKSYFKYMYPFTLIRERVRERRPEIPADAWAVHPLPADTGEYHESPRTFPYAPDLAFHSPVMRTPFRPAPVAAEILGHAHSVYGVRKWSELALGDAERRLGFFDADIKGLGIEMAVLLTFDQGTAKEMNAFARPWNASLALYSRVTARLRGRFGPEYDWGSAQPEYESYL